MGGKEILDNYLIHIAGYDTADVLYGHEATELAFDDEGVSVAVREPDGGQRTITAGAVVLARGGFEGNRDMLRKHPGRDAEDLPIIVPGIKYNRGACISMATGIGAETDEQFDPDGRVLDHGGNPIPRLYAAGEITGHFHRKHPASTSVLRASAFGRIVGTSVARSLPHPAAATG